MATQEWREANRDKMCAYRREHYSRNKKLYIDRAKARNKYEAKKCSNFINEYKLSRGCSMCGYNSAPEALDLHHVRGKKEFCVSLAAYRNKMPLHRLKEEIEKCEVVCANCHRIETKRIRINNAGVADGEATGFQHQN